MQKRQDTLDLIYKELKEFKQEMTEFKQEMTEFKQEMTEFKHDVKNRLDVIEKDIKDMKTTPTMKKELASS